MKLFKNALLILILTLFSGSTLSSEVQIGLEDKLRSAVVNGDSEGVKTHIAAGANVDARDRNKQTALIIAAEKGNADIVRILIDAGANVNAGDMFDITALFKAAEKNHIDCVKILIANNGAADIELVEEAFMSALYRGNTEIVKALMVEGARMSDGTLMIAHSIANGRDYTEIVNALEKLQ